jgi:proliferating cell nuclear antigen
MSLGLNLTNMGKILKCAGNEDVVTLKSQDDGDMLTVMFESPNQVRRRMTRANEDRGGVGSQT